MVNPLITRGSRVGFNAGSRLRKINEKNQLEQYGIAEGALILDGSGGPELTGVVEAQVGTGEHEGRAFVVLLSNGAFGWVYSYELHVIDPNDPKYQ